MPRVAERADRVPVAPIRDAVLEALQRGELESFSELALLMGYPKRGGGGDTSRVRRMLGLMKPWGGHRPGGGAYAPRFNDSIGYENAVAIVRAIGRMPVEFDL
jgi:hypothetical protein